MKWPPVVLILFCCVTDQWDKGKLVTSLPSATDNSFMDKLNCSPDSNGWKGVEDFLYTFVELPNVLDLETSVRNL
jgi:hypothetical protein